MFIFLTAALSVILIIFTVLYVNGRITFDTKKCGICLCVLLLFAGAASSAPAVSAGGDLYSMLDAAGMETVNEISENGFDTENIIRIVLSAILLLPGAAAAEVSLVYAARNTSARSELIQLSSVTAVFGLIPLASALFFGCAVIFYVLGSAAVGVLALLAFSAFFVLITLGFGIIILAAAIPVFIICTGLNIAVHCAGYAAAAFLWCCVFLLLNIYAGAAAAAVYKGLFKEGRISGKKAVCYSALSFIPAVNIFMSRRAAALSENSNQITNTPCL